MRQDKVQVIVSSCASALANLDGIAESFLDKREQDSGGYSCHIFYCDILDIVKRKIDVVTQESLCHFERKDASSVCAAYLQSANALLIKLFEIVDEEYKGKIENSLRSVGLALAVSQDEQFFEGTYQNDRFIAPQYFRGDNDKQGGLL